MVAILIYRLRGLLRVAAHLLIAAGGRRLFLTQRPTHSTLSTSRPKIMTTSHLPQLMFRSFQLFRTTCFRVGICRT